MGNMFNRGLGSAGLAALLLLACASNASDNTLQGELMRVTIEREPFALRVEDAGGRPLLETSRGVGFASYEVENPHQLIAWWRWKEIERKPWSLAGHVARAERAGDELVVELAEEAGGSAVVRIKARFIDRRSLRVETEIIGLPEMNRMALHFHTGEDERYFGMGERFNSAEHSGEEVKVWSEEGGLGISHLSRLWPGCPFNPFPHGKDMTYYPVPFFLNTKGYGFLLDDTRYSLFDFGSSREGELCITNWNSRLDFVVFYGPGPLRVIEAMTAYTGRITPPLPWVFAPWNVAIGGSDRAREVAQKVRREHIPTSAIWSEDWWWRTEWEVNRERYPDYEELNQELDREGFRYLGYFQPNVSPDTEVFAEGDKQGYFTADEEGDTYVYTLAVWKKAQLDLTNPDSREWWKQSFFAKAESMGVDGWMHDFSEYTPPDSVSHDGSRGWELHNLYPVLWAELGREFWDRARPDGDYVFFVRGGYTGTQRYAPVMWTGDQNANFERLDGLPSNIPAITSVGISGHPIGTTDIAGYHCLLSTRADKELFMRWTELGSLLPVMRNHRGLITCRNWRFDRDRETLVHYKKYARLHASLFPYIYTLVYEAADRGWPVVRHLVLHFPDDPGSAQQDYQYLLGDRLLVAPVIERGAKKWEVYFPPGEWRHFWSESSYRGPGSHTVPAPPGEVPLFVRHGKVLPLFGSTIDTLVKEDRDDLFGFDDANSCMEVLFAGEGSDDYELWDGTVISCRREDGAEGSCRVRGAPVGREYTFVFK